MIDKAIIAVLAWFITVYKFKAMWRDGQWRTGSVTFYFWAFSLFTAIGLTMMVWPVYLAFDRFIGLPNLAWLVTYAAFSLAIYCISAGCYLVLGQPRPQLMLWSLLVTLTLLTVIYAMGIVTLPEKPDHTVPTTLFEMAFMETLYVYLAVFCAIPLVTFTQLFQREQIISARLRWLVGILASLLAFVVLVMKIVLTVLAYQNPNTAALGILHPLITLGVVIVGVLCPVAFLPNSIYRAVSRPFELADKILALYELKTLQKRLDPLCPPVIDDNPGWQGLMKNVDFHLYRVVIAILDAKETLAGYAGSTQDLSRMLLSTWDEQLWRRAQLLHCELQQINDHQTFPELVKSYQKASRIIRWRIWFTLSSGGIVFDATYQS
jgi:hypothetical protein